MNKWTKGSWKNFPVQQQPTYNNLEQLQRELQKIKQVPPVITKEEVQNFKKQLKEVSQGERVILHMGDCAERFTDCTPQIITQKQIFMEICSEIIQNITGKKVLKVGRIAGQFGKPRSQEYDEQGIYNYKGDNINSLDINDRTPDPQKLYQGFLCTLSTVNIIRGNFINFLDDHRNYQSIKNQMTDHFRTLSNHEHVVDVIDLLDKCQDSFNQMYPSEEEIEQHKKCINNRQQYDQESENKHQILLQNINEHGNNLKSEMMRTSHEGLILDLEEAQTFETSQGEFYNLSTDFLWVGLRTNQIDGAHIEYVRGIKNPIGVKIGPQTTEEQFLSICSIVNPENKNNKLIIIPRLGAKNIKNVLPKLIQTKIKNNLNFIWMLDAMHGNTETENSFKVRKIDNIISEIKDFCQILHQYNQQIGGLSLEATHEDVTECLGTGIDSHNLCTNYKTACDPRLNGLQTLQILYEFTNYHNQLINNDTQNYLNQIEQQQDSAYLSQNKSPKQQFQMKQTQNFSSVNA
ncbi:hypothetical protein PPERSA_00801 [Pseudocohnilembus persalinus]|uniref:Phospho-2-dehydro-3-deoxyheptonate aldolase n=1 Tax=Pseudocohnilembus persalinus TaxID=266149 RepID=A0A0V0QFR7_PSEPJ|nr:hypothetical protein PPERSA_00801 [Pseudocohnilembus persalinus]|eukprot:KRX01053.1 hypothetical protein PPERSA_00801 [Pseudocohnilembus persalinus]